MQLHNELMHTYEAEAGALSVLGSLGLRRFLIDIWAVSRSCQAPAQRVDVEVGAMGISPQAWARASSERGGRTVLVWVAAVVVSAGILIVLLGGALSQGIYLTNAAESERAATVTEERLRHASDTEAVRRLVDDQHGRRSHLSRLRGAPAVRPQGPRARRGGRGDHVLRG